MYIANVTCSLSNIDTDLGQRFRDTNHGVHPFYSTTLFQVRYKIPCLALHHMVRNRLGQRRASRHGCFDAE
jgi:hypothetical protein